jgi:hypothetical protein
VATIPLGFDHVAFSRSGVTIEFPAEDRKTFYDRVFQPLVSVITANPSKMKLTPVKKKLLLRLHVHTVPELLQSLSNLRKQLLETLAGIE